ncbi:fibronectin type III domain protein [Ilumatobacter fluminis]|uniref:Fibronectin type III domain protein n=1 Tax=Ilumatobacter fluminis TaxID=467091 RepID=A0A4R7I6K3_9ACTN|nr:fibronectin type III domain-containing protein [Ilumatobacter fluminis]TDT18486.1 fibronectin type III domain protein [Ilumatobacter fluminis]
MRSIVAHVLTAMMVVMAGLALTPAGAAQAQEATVPFEAYVNFHNQTSIPSGYPSPFPPSPYVSDVGAPYAEQGDLTYGWVLESDGVTPVDIRGMGRNRNRDASDWKRDSIIHMGSGDVSNGVTCSGTPGCSGSLSTNATWEIAVPDGNYAIEVAVGEPNPGNDPETHTLDIEGVRIVDAYVPTGAASIERVQVFTGDVTVTDGELTVSAAAGTNTKIAYIDIVQAPGPVAPADVTAVPGATFGSIDVSWTASPTADDYEVFRDGASVGVTAATTLSDAPGVVGSYDYTVVARNLDGVSPAAGPATALITNAQCGDISLLTCGEIPVALPFSLDWSSDEGALVDSVGVGTGFTMAAAPSARLASDGDPFDPGVPGYEPGPSPAPSDPAQLVVDTTDGQLEITSSKGINYYRPEGSSDTNSQLNMLGVGVDPAGGAVITATIDPIDFAASAGNNSQQGGIWYGLDEDNFAKLVVAKVDGSNVKVQLQAEVAGGSILDANSGPLEINSANFAAGSEVTLVLTVDTNEGTPVVTGTYAVDGGTPVAVTNSTDSSLAIPASFVTADGTAPYAGVFTTQRRAVPDAPIVVPFDSFGVEALYDVVAPVAPANVAATGGDAQVDLTWDEVVDGDLAGYNVYRSETSPVDLGAAPLAQVVGAEIYTDNAVTNGTTYHYAVTAIDGTGNESGISAEANATPAEPADTTPPAVPANVTATVDGDDILVSWEAVGDLDLEGYRVYVLGVERTTTPITETSLLVTGLTPGVEYGFTVAAEDASGNLSAQSASAAATIPGGEPLAFPTFDAVPGTEPGTVLTSWTIPPVLNGPPIVQYRIQKSIDGGANWTWGATERDGASDEKLILNLEPGAEYTFRIRAWDGGEWGPYSAEAVASATPTPGDPLAVNDVDAEAGTVEGIVLVTWTLPTGPVDEYRIQKSLDGSNWTWGATVRDAGATSKLVENLVPGTEYQFRVRARSGSTWGPYSDAATATAPTPADLGVPLGIAEPTATSGALVGSILLTWEAPTTLIGPEVQEYRIQKKIEGGPWQWGATVRDGDATSQLVTDLNPGSSYQLRIRAWDGTDWGPWSPSATAVASSEPQPATMTADPSTVEFVLDQDGISITDVAITGDEGPLTLSVVEDTPWLSVLVGGDDVAGFAVNAVGLAPGTYNASVTFSSPGYDDLVVPVTLTIRPDLGIMTADPASLSFSFDPGDDPVGVASTVITGDGETPSLTIVDDADWLSTLAGANNTIAVLVNSAGLAPGTYTAEITFSDPSYEDLIVPVTLTVSAPLGTLTASPDPVEFSVVEGETDSTTVTVTGDGAAPTLTATESLSWLTVTEDTPGSFTFDVDTIGLAVGEVSGDVEFTAPDYTDLTVGVSLDVTEAPAVPCSPISTLDCSDVEVALPFTLTFDGTEGGLVDGDDESIGFTMVDDPSEPRLTGDPAVSNPNVPGYEPGLLDLDATAGSLTIDATKGIQYLDPPASSNNNTLLNALGVGVDVGAADEVVITATMDPAAWRNEGNSAQAGIWFGLDEDNYVKLVLAEDTAAGVSDIQLLREIGGVTNPGDTADGLDVLNVADTEPVTLQMVIAGDQVSANYALGSGALTPVVEASIDHLDIPASFTDGAILPDGESGPVSFAGIFATNRNGSNTPGIDPEFLDFSVTADFGEPGLLAASPTSVSLSAEVDEGDSALIDVVETGGLDVPLTVTTDGAAWLTFNAPNLTTPSEIQLLGNATGLAVGQYTATVTVDADGYDPIEIPVTFDVVEGAPPFELDVNFQSETAPVPAGYVRDFGQSFNTRTLANQGDGSLEYGWLAQGGTTPLNLSTNGRDRDRTGIDQLLDTVIHMQYGDVDGGNGTNGNTAPGRWEVAVPNGVYEVTVSVGDQQGSTAYDSQHAVNVEGMVAIESFQATASDEYEEVTVTVGVQDGRLSIDAIGGFNTKLNYVNIVEVANAPFVTAVRPLNRSADADPTDGVAADISVPGVGVGVDPTTLAGNVHLYDVVTGTEVPSTVGSSGGNDVIALDPDDTLLPDRQYRFVVTSDVLSITGDPFVPFTSVFTTGDGVVVQPDEFEPMTGVSFQKVEQTLAAGDYIASMVFGPDGKLYTTTIGQGLYRYDVAADGTLSNRTAVGPTQLLGRAVIGIVFDESATAGNLSAWVTHASGNIGGETAEWGSAVSYISGPTLSNYEDVFTNLPRSRTDHLSNSLGYGPDGDLYFLQGSNQAAGDTDSSWGDRGETLLTAAMLRFDPDHPAVQSAIGSGPAVDVQTADVSSPYDPYAVNAPLTIYATGIRNAYDFVYHSNGHIYVPTNGTAGGGNSPGVNVTPDVGQATSFARTGRVPGDYTDACLNHRIDGQPYAGGDVPAYSNHATQEDHLYDVQEGKYYGHPNPERCEWVLHSGNPTSGQDPNERTGGSNYPVGVQPDSNYDGIAYNFGFNKSPNGVIEYQSRTFGGQLEGRILVIRFSNNNDIVFLQADSETGEILGAQTQEGVTGVANSTIGGVGNFADPLEIIEDPNTGNLYVNQYDRGGSQQRLYLLRVPEGQEAAGITADEDELVFSGALSSPSQYPQFLTDTQTVEITNVGDSSITLDVSISGGAAVDYASTGDGQTLAGGASTTLTVTFDPSVVGIRNAVLEVSDGETTTDIPLYGLAAPALEGGNEPTLTNVLATLGHPADTGWTGLAGGMPGTERGDETYEPLFVKANSGSVTMTPVAMYAPNEAIPYGWYTGDGSAANRNVVGAISVGQHQTLLPTVGSGGVSFDPGTAEFGLFYDSATFNRIGYTEDELNDSGGIRRARIYPATTRTGSRINDAFIVAFEDASNGDYQDYVFLVRNVEPASGPIDPPPPTGDTIRVNFQSETAPVPAGYVRDFGQPFGARTGADQGTGLTYGWLDEDDDTPVDITPNGRDRGLNTDQRLDTLMHVQPEDVSGTFNGNATNSYWEIVVANGTYSVTVAAGDAAVNNYDNDPEFHSINVEGVTAIDRHEPIGVDGAAGQHATATVTVTVTDGRLTLDADGGENSKFDYVEITPAVVDPPEGGVQVNFTSNAASTPAGWVSDTGLAYDSGRGYGWLVGSTPTDRSNAARYRTGPAGQPVLQGFNIIQNDVVESLTNGTWEYDVPNGEYFVQVSVGDNDYADSTHSIAVEGVNIVGEYVPSGLGDFETSSGLVTVSDGKLTMTSGFGGSNTKVNSISFVAAGEDETPPTIDVALDGVPAGTDTFAGPVTVTITASDFGSQVEFLNYAVDGGTVQAYTTPFEVDGLGSHTVDITATDAAGNEATEQITFDIVPPSLARIDVVNDQVSRLNGEPIPGFSDEIVVMHRLNSLGSSASWENLEFNDTATLTVSNTGTEDLVISDLDITGGQAAQFTLVTPPTLPLTITPGNDTTLTVQFVANSGSKGVRTANLEIVSSDPTSPTTVINLRGGYMTSPEGNNELALYQIIDLFGWTTSVGSNSGMSIGNGSENPGSPLNGDEVRSYQWKRLDPSKPVNARQIAAFHGCCGQTETININGASQTHAGAYGQAIYPIKSNGTPVFINTNPSGNFGITVSGQSTTQTAYMAVKLWPVIDGDGQIVPGSWIVGHDYIGSPSQCGTGATNCDFQDNVYLVTNIVPVDSNDDTAPAAPANLVGTLDDPAVDLDWDDGAADVAGYYVERASTTAGPWTRIVGQPITTSAYTDPAPLGGTSAYRVIAVDASLNESVPSNAVEVDTPEQALPTIRINAGGPQVTTGGLVWAADTSGGRSYSNAAVTQIANTTDDVLYFTTRSDNSSNFGYDVAVPNGTYTVRLHFAEVYFGATGGGAGSAGARVFSINLEGGAPEKANYSIFGEVGAMAADIEQFTVTVTDGNLDIDLNASANQPSINAIEIIPA